MVPAPPLCLLDDLEVERFDERRNTSISSAAPKPVTGEPRINVRTCVDAWLDCLEGFDEVTFGGVVVFLEDV